MARISLKRPKLPLVIAPVPENLNYDLWLGANEPVPYNSLYHPRTWRGFNRFGSGTTSLMPKAATDWDWTISNRMPKHGTFYKGERNLGYTDNRSNNPRLTNREKMIEFKKSGYPAEKYARVKNGPVRELVDVIKGNLKEAGSNFDYAAPFTEVMLLGLIVSRHGGKIEWDSKKMLITNRPELNVYLKDPVRKGWEYGKSLWT